jgi:deoxyadenosine/deoxycytidine kinase
VPSLVDRINKRGRGYEQKIPQSYLELLDMLNKRWLSENKTIPVMMVSTDGLNIVRKKSAQKKLLEQIKKRMKI